MSPPAAFVQTRYARLLPLMLCLALVLTACKPSDAPAPPAATFATDFEPRPDGFSFRNYGIGYPEGDLTIEEARELFGDAVCARIDAGRCIPTPAAQLWIDSMNSYMQEGGRCVGFTVMSHRLYNAQMAPSAFDPETAVTFDIEQRTAIMRKISQNYVYQVLEEVWSATVEGTPREIIDQLLDRSEHVDLGIFSRDGRGHSIVARAVEYKGNGIYWILGYDNNLPGQDVHVEVDYNANTWRYSLAGLNPNGDPEAWEGDATTNSLMFVPFSAYDQPVSCPFCEETETGALSSGGFLARPVSAGSGGPYTYIAARGKSVLQLTNAQGERLGLFEDQYVNEIPGARLVRMRGALSALGLFLVMPSGQGFTLEMAPRPGGGMTGAGVRGFGPGLSFAVDGLNLEAGEQGTIAFSHERQQFTFTASGEQSPLLQLVLERDGTSYLILLGNGTLQAGQSLTLGIDPQTGQLIISGGNPEDNTFSIAIAKIDPSGAVIFANDELTIPTGGSVALDLTQWNGEGSIDMQVDQDGDGIMDGTAPLQDNPLASLLDEQGGAAQINALLSELASYMDGAEIDAFLEALGMLGLSGADLGDILFAFNLFGLDNAALADFLLDLDLPVEQLAALLFALHPEDESLEDLLQELSLPDDVLATLLDQLLLLKEINGLRINAQFEGMSNEELAAAISNLLARRSTPTPTATFTPTPVPIQFPSVMGPDIEDFPAGYNPLTGLPVDDPAMLDLPAVLISVTNFPVSARPQAGLSFAAYIYEIYISEGMTRFLTVFYGEYPEREEPVTGECEIRSEIFQQTGPVVGNFVWLDKDRDGIQDYGEAGIAGICVNLYDSTTGALLQSTTTDSNGFYGFNVTADQAYFIEFEKPSTLLFTVPDAGNDDEDSDADPSTGRTPVFGITSGDRSWDAGLVRAPVTPTETETPTATPEGGGPPPPPPPPEVEITTGEVGPVRSGRLPYVYIRNFFSGGCLIFASASQEILAQLPGCAMQFGSDETDINSAMLDVTRMRKIAEQSKKTGWPINYSGNVFSTEPPPGGQTANSLSVFYNFLNQTLWRYDPLSQSFLRFDDMAKGTGEFFPSTDRLTGRQLRFENVVVVFAEHTALHPTVIDINLKTGILGVAYLFRDGQVYKIHWSTLAGEYEQQTSLQRPMKFVYADGTPFPLRPGHTWVHVMSIPSYVTEESPGEWLARFYAPPGSK